jgi:hypothetical protein
MKHRGPGRPPKEPNDLITVDQAVEVIREEAARKYPPEIAKLLTYAKGTIRNKIWKRELHSWKKGKYSLVSRAEVARLVS